jgi:hypothetical protein
MFECSWRSRRVLYSTVNPSASAFSRTRPSRVTMVTSGGGSPSRSAVARWTASSVRIGSTGKGRRTRSTTARSTSRMKQRRSKVRRARIAACSPSAVRRPVARARMMARPASASVSAEVTCCVPRGSFLTTVVSCSSSEATRALDSVYRTRWAAAGLAGRRAATFLAERRGALRFATVGVDEFRGRTRRQADVGPILERVASLQRRTENASGNELVPSTSVGLARSRSRRHEFRNNAPMSSHGNPFSRFDSPNIPAQVVFQLADARRHSQLWPHVVTFDKRAAPRKAGRLRRASPAESAAAAADRCG